MAADFQMPDLAQLQFLPPGLNQIAGQQIQNAQSAQTQGLAGMAADNQAKTLQNLFDTQANPVRLRGLTLGNDSKDMENQLTKEKLSPEAVAARRDQWIKESSDAKLEKVMADAKRGMVEEEDPVKQKKWQDMYMRSDKEVSARAKAADDMAQAKMTAESHERIAAGNNQTSRDVANIGSQGRQAVAALRKGVSDDMATDLGSAKTDAQRISVYDKYIQRANDGQDFELAQALQQRRQAEEQARLQRATAGQQVTAGQKPDISQFGIKPQGQVPVPQAVNPYAGGAPAAAQGPANFTLKPDGSNLQALRAVIQRMPEPDRTRAANQLEAQVNGAAPQQAPQQQAPTAPAPDGRVSVVGPDGKTGTIPAAQLQQALKQGYKQR